MAFTKDNSYPIAIDQINPGTEFSDEIKEVYSKAEHYLSAFEWCDDIKRADLYFNMGYAIGVFLFEVNNNQSSDDSYIWVIAGDLPTMYLDVHGARSIKEVLLSYAELAEEWANNVLKGLSIEECFPFDVETEKELASLLLTRAHFIRDEIVGAIEDVKMVIE